MSNAYNLRLTGYTITQLKTERYSDAEILQAGYTAIELRLAGYSAIQLKNAGYSNKSIIQGGYKNKQLKSVGIKTAYELRKMGYSAFQIANEGYNTKNFKELKFTPSELFDPEVPPSQMRSVGYSIADMKRAGLNVAELLQIGFQLRRIVTAGYGLDDLLIANVAPQEIQKLKLPSVKTLYTPTELANAGLSVSYLRLVGFTASELKAVGFTATDLRRGGYDTDAINSAGYSLLEMKDAGIFAYELSNVGYTAGQLIGVGYNVSQLKTTGLPFFTNIMIFGYTSIGGLVNFMTSENATAYNNAGLVVAGGIGIAKDLYLNELYAKSPIKLDISGQILHDGTNLKFVHLLENGSISFVLKENGKIECIGNIQFQFPNKSIEINDEKFNIPCTTLATSTTTGALTCVGGISSENNIYAPTFIVGDNEDIKLSSTGIITNSQTNIVVSGDTLTIGKNTENRTLAEASATLQINGATGVAFSFSKQQANSQTTSTDLTISTAGVVNVTNETQSTSTSSGSLQNNGGLGVEKNVNVGGTLSVWDLLNSGTLQQTGTTMTFSSGDGTGTIPSATTALFSSSSSSSFPASMSNANLHTFAYNSAYPSSQKNILSQSFSITSSDSLTTILMTIGYPFFTPIYLIQGQIVKGVVYVCTSAGSQSDYYGGIYGKGYLPIRLAQTNLFTLAQGFNYVSLQSSWTVPVTDIYYVGHLTLRTSPSALCINSNSYLAYSTTAPANGTLSKASQYYGIAESSTISGFTSRTTVLSGLATIIVGVAVNASQNRLVICYYQGPILYSTWNGSSWSSPASILETINRSWIAITMSADGSRIVAIAYNGLCYYGTWNGSNYSTLTQTLETTSRVYRALDMTSDGSRIVTVVDNTKPYFATWNGTNYTAFTQTLDTTTSCGPGIGITNDGSRIAYFNNSNPSRLYYADWNGSNYTSPVTSIVLPMNVSRNVKFSADYSYLIISTQGSSSPYYYVSIANSTFSTIQSIPTTSLPATTDGWALYVSRDGITIYACDLYSSTMHKTNINYVTSSSVTSLPSQVPNVAMTLAQSLVYTAVYG